MCHELLHIFYVCRSIENNYWLKFSGRQYWILLQSIFKQHQILHFPLVYSLFTTKFHLKNLKWNRKQLIELNLLAWKKLIDLFSLYERYKAIINQQRFLCIFCEFFVYEMVHEYKNNNPKNFVAKFSRTNVVLRSWIRPCGNVVRSSFFYPLSRTTCTMEIGGAEKWIWVAERCFVSYVLGICRVLFSSSQPFPGHWVWECSDLVTQGSEFSEQF